jgi:hypothetical protein
LVLAELAARRVHRRDVHDAAPAALDHAVDHVARHVEDAGEVGVDDRVPMLLGHLAEGRVARDAGAVHEHGDRAVVGRDLRTIDPMVAKSVTSPKARATLSAPSPRRPSACFQPASVPGMP